MKWHRLLIVSGAILASACNSVHATGQRMGKIYPRLATGCPVRFENMSYDEARTSFEQIGLVTLSGTTEQPQSWEGETKDKLWPKVCELGGTVVTLNGAADGVALLGGMGTGLIQFAVWREL